MKIFLSWHGTISYKVALALRDWLPKVIQAVRPFISSDIEKGGRWSDAVAKELNETTYGIICLTPYNLKAPWMNFEAGALSKAVHESAVSPFLFRIERSKVEGPLQQFQWTKYEKSEVLKLLFSINGKLPVETQLTTELLTEEFEMWWPQLQKQLDGISEVQSEETETGYQWLCSEKDLANTQAKINCKEIWMITPDLHQIIADSRAKEVMKTNVGRNVSYILITPETCEIEDMKDDINRFFGAKAECIKIKKIEAKQFQRSAVTNYIILNPEEDEAHPLHVFFEVPIEARGYWIEVNNEAALEFVNRFNDLIGQSS